jgi:TonB family protein
MNAPILVAGLTAWSLQTALLLAVGLLLPRLFRLRAPRVCLAYRQGLLLMILLLPLLQPRAGMVAFAEEIAVAGPWLGQIAGSGTGSMEGFTWQQALLAVIAAGALGRLAWLGVGLRTLRSYRREAAPARLEPELSELALLLAPRARLAVSSRVGSPVTFGWRDPVILLPADFLELPVETRRGIVCHELLHVRRRDWLFALFEEGVRALFWFHPAVWMLLSRIALSREQVVDREAVRLTGSRRAYLEALRAVACQTWQTTVPGLPFFHRGHLLERVAQLCKEVPMSRSRVATLVTTFAGLLALTAFLGLLAFPMSPLSGTAWAGAEPLKVEGDVQRPQLIKSTSPIYPDAARKEGREGKVVVKTVIDEQGNVTEPTVEGSSGHQDIDQSALDTVSAWKFRPATLEGKPVTVHYTLTINFTLEEKPGHQ